MDIYLLINMNVCGLTGGWRETRASENITPIVLSHNVSDLGCLVNQAPLGSVWVLTVLLLPIALFLDRVSPIFGEH